MKNQESKVAAAPPSPPASPRKEKKAGKRSVDSEGFAPPKQLIRKARSPRSGKERKEIGKERFLPEPR
ncbi:hypothetical protein TNCV_3852861 [Trichonephila clavipes]|nr:hypothetical protein TNCV_3852861 [Trichonephila clavipes]